MSSRLETFVEEVRAAFAASDPTGALGPYEEPINVAGRVSEDVRWFLGGEFLQTDAGWPCVKICAPRSTFATNAGPGYVKSANSSDERRGRRVVDIRWVLYGRDLEETEDMVHHLINAFAAAGLAGLGDFLKSEEWSFAIDESTVAGGQVAEVVTAVPFQILASDRERVMRPLVPNPSPGAGLPLANLGTFETDVTEGDETITFRQEPIP